MIDRHGGGQLSVLLSPRYRCIKHGRKKDENHVESFANK